MRIGRLRIKPLYLVLLTLGLLLIVGGTIALLNNPAVWYEYGYGFKWTDLEGLTGQRIDFETVLAKGDTLKGKLVVESGEFLLVIIAKNELQEAHRIVDSGVIPAGKSFSFSLASDWSFTSYETNLFFSDYANARFYCNLNPEISGKKKVPLSDEEKSRIVQERARITEVEWKAYLEAKEPTEKALAYSFYLGASRQELEDIPEFKDIIVTFRPVKLR